jgi:hypothetical protein
MLAFSLAYETIPPITWAYMSSLLMIALFFKFNRFWSVRNFDLLLIILLAPGIMLVEQGRQPFAGKATASGLRLAAERFAETEGPTSRNQSPPRSNGDTETPSESRSNQAGDSGNPGIAPPQIAPSDPLNPPNPPIIAEPPGAGQHWQRLGYLWLFIVSALFLFRLLFDPKLVRKPLLNPNLDSGGLIFLGMSLMVFLFANIAISEPSANDLRGARNALKLMQRQAAEEEDVRLLRREGPGYWLFNLFPVISTFNSSDEILESDPNEAAQLARYIAAAKSLAIVSQLVIVVCLVLFCQFNFGSFNVGVGVATIYLMLPYTAIFTGYTLHALPAALLLSALLFFRSPWLAGILMGLATGVSYYPIFLLPLWCSFYWERGFRSFLIGVGVSLAFCILGLAFTSPDFSFFVYQLRAMFGFLLPRTEGLEGIWALGWSPWYRLPLLVAHVALAVSFIFWPSVKDLGTLISYTAALMVAVQFWLGYDGGLTMAWYLPFALLVFFRPNLSGRVATVELIRKRRGGSEPPAEILV